MSARSAPHPTLATRLLDRAEALLAGEPPGCTPTIRQRAAAFLARQALEELLAQLWQRREPGMEGASMRAQLAVLGEYVREEELVAGVGWAWGELSSACHAEERASHALDGSLTSLRHLSSHRALSRTEQGPIS
jgi:hypothetical protein